MLGILDAELFPDDCEVIEIPPHNQHVYLVQKNANTSLRRENMKHGYRIYRNEEIQQLNIVDVYIRNPRSRYISGVNTYLQHLQRDKPELDYKTAFWFAKNYKFLNRHYLPQFYWVYNLSKFLDPSAKLRLRDFKTIGSITDFQDRAKVIPPTKEFVQQLLDNNNDIEFWWYVDQILLDLAGQEYTWQELVDHYNHNFPEVIKRVLSKA
jgi:hypothetical protein